MRNEKYYNIIQRLKKKESNYVNLTLHQFLALFSKKYIYCFLVKIIFIFETSM